MRRYILVRKGWTDTDLEFFPGSNMLASIRPILEQTHPKTVARKLSLLTSWCWCSAVRFYLITSRCQLPKTTTSCPLLSTYRVEGRNIRFRSLHTCVHDLRTSSFLWSFLLTTSALAELSGDCQLYLFNYLFIYSISIFYELLNLLAMRVLIFYVFFSFYQVTRYPGWTVSRSFKNTLYYLNSCAQG